MSRRRQISGPDGRALDVELSGPERGQAILFHTGTRRSRSRRAARIVWFRFPAVSGWLAMSPGRRRSLREGEGHLSLLVRAYDEVLNDLLAGAR